MMCEFYIIRVTENRVLVMERRKVGESGVDLSDRFIRCMCEILGMI